MKNKDYHRLKDRAVQLLPLIGGERAARVAALLGVAVVALSLAQLTWQFFPTTPSTTSLPVAPSSQANSGSRGGGASTISGLVGLHLFGQPLVAPGGAVNAPETTLNLVLRGIFALDGERALAIIANAGSDEQPYRVGDSVPGGALVHEILPDRVILEREGRFETLTLPKDMITDGVNAAAPLPGNTGTTSATAARLGEIRNQLKANPADALAMNALQPVMENGQLKGYQLGENPYTPLLRDAGLQTGDIVTQVNGISVTDPARGAELINLLSNAGRIDLEVERGGSATRLSVELGR